MSAEIVLGIVVAGICFVAAYRSYRAEELLDRAAEDELKRSCIAHSYNAGNDPIAIMLRQDSERAQVQAVSSIITSMAAEEAKTLRVMAENDQAKALFDAIASGKDFTAEEAHKAFSGIKRNKEQQP